MDTGIAIFTGAVLATAGWLYTGRLQRRMDRRQHTYRILTRQQDDEKFNNALKRIRMLLSKGTIPDPSDETRQEDIEQVDYLLNHYEFMCAAIWVGDVDENLIRLCEYSRITKLPNVLQKYISRSREFREQPTMYENLEDVARRWHGNRPLPAERVLEVIMFRPCRECPRWAAISHRAISWTVSEYRSVISKVRN